MYNHHTYSPRSDTNLIRVRYGFEARALGNYCDSAPDFSKKVFESRPASWVVFWGVRVRMPTALSLHQGLLSPAVDSPSGGMIEGGFGTDSIRF